MKKQDEEFSETLDRERREYQERYRRLSQRSGPTPGFQAFVIFVILAVCLALVVIDAEAEETVQVETVRVLAACSAATALVASQSDGVFAEAIYDESIYFRDALALMVGDDAANLQIGILMKNLQSQYNSGRATWDNLVTFASQCSEFKKEAKT